MSDYYRTANKLSPSWLANKVGRFVQEGPNWDVVLEIEEEGRRQRRGFEWSEVTRLSPDEEAAWRLSGK